MVDLYDVELISTGYYLPGQPIPFEEVEDILGYLDKSRSQMKKMIPRLKKMMAGILKARYCYFAINPVTKKPTENNADMSVKAIRKALEKAKLKVNDLECIILGAPIPDFLVPATTTLIQEQLGIERCAEIEIHANCTAITKAMQVGYDSIRVGRYKTVAVVYSQNPSAYLNSDYYNQDKVEPENLLLRWFLSDCAGAAILTARGNILSGLKVIGVYNDSVGSTTEMGMWLKLGGANFNLLQAFQDGSHHFGQNYGLVNEKAPLIGVEALGNFLKQLNIKGEEIGHLIVTLPSLKLEDVNKELGQKRLNIPQGKWFSNVDKKGYCGGASLLSCLDDMLEEGLVKKGEIIVCFAVESSKWMNGGFALQLI